MIAALLAALATIAVLLLGGCQPGDTLSLQKEPEYIKVPLQPAREMVATIRTIAKDRIAVAESLCAQNKLTAAQCQQMHLDIQGLKQLDFEVTRALDNPKAELDTKKIIKMLEISAKLIGAVM